MKVINKKLTTSFVQLDDERISDADFTADINNTGVVTISLASNPSAIVEKLNAGDSFTRETPMNLKELQAKSTVLNDVLIIRW